MLPYLICFSLSCFLLWFGQNIKLGKSEWFRWVIYGIALLIPVTLAGVRDWTVGRDVLGYAYPVFREACTVPHIGAFSGLYDTWMGTSFLLLSMAVCKVSDDFNVFLFSLMLIQIIFVFLAVYQWRDKFPIWIGMFIFYFYFFNTSLNTMRQCLALSIVFFGIKYIFRRKFLFFAFWVFLGYLFHASVLILLVYYPLFWYANKYASTKMTLLLSVIFLLLVVFSQQILVQILLFASSLFDISYYADKGIFYLTATEEERTGYKNFIYYSFFMILFLYKRKYILSHFPDAGRFMEITLAITLIAQALLFFVGSLVQRFIMIPNWWLCILLPVIIYSYKKTISKVMVLFYCILFWFYYAFINVSNDQLYSSSIMSSIF